MSDHDHTKYECEVCEWEGAIPQMAAIDDIVERVMPGELMPAGQCPECESLIGIDDADIPTYTLEDCVRIAAQRTQGNTPAAIPFRIVRTGSRPDELYDVVSEGTPDGAHKGVHSLLVRGVRATRANALMFAMAPSLLRELIDAWPQFDADEEVSGADLVDWFGEFRARAKEVYGL